METQTSYEYRTNQANRDSSPAEVLEAVGALRDYMRSMDAQVKELLSERERLHAEVERLRERQSEPPWKQGAHRVTDELDHLVRLYETASRRRSRPPRRVERSSYPAPASSDTSALLKKMFMFLMMTELAA